MVYFYLGLSILMIYLLAGYDSRYQSCKAFTISRPLLQRLFLFRGSFFKRGKRLQKDRNKMSIWGVCFYLWAAVVLLLGLVLWLLPDIPIPLWVLDTGRFIVYAQTGNAKLFALSILLLLLAIVGYTACVAGKGIRKTYPQWAKVLLWFVTGCMLLGAVLASVYLWVELVSSLLLLF